MKSSLFLALGAAALTLVAACGGDFSGVVEGEDAGVTGRDASPVTTDAGGTVDSGATPPPELTAFTAEEIYFPVVYEDEHLLVIDKPAGLVVHPAAGN